MASTYPLKGLQEIRDRRLNDSVTARMGMHKKLEQTQQELSNKRKEFEDYKIWRKDEEERRYANFMNKTYSLDEIHKFNASIKQLYFREVEIEEDVKKAEYNVKQAQKEYEKALEEERLNRKKLKKLETHRDMWEMEQRKYQEIQAELELEDFSPRSSSFQ
jgi:chromosome segregation ATPase